jgi:hypothetical protein
VPLTWDLGADIVGNGCCVTLGAERLRDGGPACFANQSLPSAGRGFD